jgi:hypothetical protein
MHTPFAKIEAIHGRNFVSHFPITTDCHHRGILHDRHGKTPFHGLFVRVGAVAQVYARLMIAPCPPTRHARCFPATGTESDSEKISVVKHQLRPAKEQLPWN